MSMSPRATRSSFSGRRCPRKATFSCQSVRGTPASIVLTQPQDCLRLFSDFAPSGSYSGLWSSWISGQNFMIGYANQPRGRDVKVEHRKFVAEALGTAILVIVAVGTATLSFGFKLFG